jgi:hypothetical protein
MAVTLLADLLLLLRRMFQSRAQLAAENLFLRKQLACYIERGVRPRRADNAARITLVLLSPFVDWRQLLTIVRPDTLVRWHRDLFRLFWRLKSRQRGRPRIPIEVHERNHQGLDNELIVRPASLRGAGWHRAPRAAVGWASQLLSPRRVTKRGGSS